MCYTAYAVDRAAGLTVADHSKWKPSGHFADFSFCPRKIVKTFDELILALENNDFEFEKVKPFLNKNFKYKDGKSSERLVKDLFNKFFQ